MKCEACSRETDAPVYTADDVRLCPECAASLTVKPDESRPYKSPGTLIQELEASVSELDGELSTWREAFEMAADGGAVDFH